MIIRDTRRALDMKREFVPHLDVLCRLADAFWTNSALKKTHMHFASRVSWASFDRYVDWLGHRNYIERITVGNSSVYRMTGGGREMFSAILKFKEIVNSPTAPFHYSPQSF